MYAVTLTITFINKEEMKAAVAKMPKYITSDVQDWLGDHGQISYDITLVPDDEIARIVMSYRFQDEAAYEVCWREVWGKWDNQGGPRQIDKRSISKGPVILQWDSGTH